MQNNINIIEIPAIPANSQSRKRNSSCKPHSHGRHQPLPSPPPPHLCTEVKCMRMEVQAGMCEKSKVGTVPPRNFTKTPQKPLKCSHLPTNAQNTKQQEKHITSSPPSPPMCRTRTRSTRETQHTIRIRMDVITPSPPHPPQPPHRAEIQMEV